MTIKPLKRTLFVNGRPVECLGKVIHRGRGALDALKASLWESIWILWTILAWGIVAFLWRHG